MAGPDINAASTGVRVWSLAAAAGLVAGATAAGLALHDALPETDLLMFYLLAVVVASFRLPRVASLATAVGAVAAFNFFFTAPRYTFFVNERRHLLTFAGFGALGVLVSTLAARAREREAVAARRESEARGLFSMARALADATDAEALGRAGLAQAEALLGLRGVVRLGPPSALRVVARTAPEGEAEGAAAQRAAEQGAPTVTEPGMLHLPLVAGGECHGVLGLWQAASAEDPRGHYVRDTLVSQLASALAREVLARRSAEESRRADRERMRSSLLASVSHDLRTPLAAITGAATTLLAAPARLEAGAQVRLLGQIVQESHRLERLVQNLLHLTRLEDDVAIELDWQVAQEIAGSAAARLAGPGRAVIVRGPEEALLVRCDALLVEQALVNLVENAFRHGSGPVEVEVAAPDGWVRFAVSDRGPGIPPEARSEVFLRFVRRSSAAGGVGLGLAIVKAVAEVHGGRAEVSTRDGGGCTVALTLPAGGPAGDALPELP